MRTEEVPVSAEEESPEIPEEAPPAPKGLFRLPRWLWAGAAAVLLLAVLAAAALLGGGDPGDGLVSAEEEPPLTEEEIAALFEGATRFGGGIEEELRSVLAADGVSAVILSGDSQLTIQNGPLELTKPLLVEEGARLELRQTVTVEGEGLLRIEGAVYNEGILRAADGGKVSVGASGALTGSTLVWLEREGDLQVAQGGQASMAGENWGEAGSEDRFLVLWEEALFQNAVHVKSWDQYKTAMEDRNTTAIVIDQDMTIPAGEQVSHYVPVLVSEGVTVTAQNFQEEIFSDWDWYIDASVLVNRGTLKLNLCFGDGDGDQVEDAGTILNLGTVQGCLFLDCAGALVNEGALTIHAAQVIQSDLYNLGNLTLHGVEGENFLNLFCDTACNFGSITLDGNAEGYLTLTNGNYFYNYGTLAVEDGGRLDNQAILDNWGTLTVEAGGAFQNLGYCAGTGTLTLDPDSVLDHGGVIQYFGAQPLQFPTRTNYGSGALAVVNYSGGYRRVSTEAELRAALEDDSCPLVVAAGDLTVYGDLTVTKGLQVTDGLLTLSGGLTLSGEDALFWGAVNLSGGALTLHDGAVAIATSLERCGSLTLEEEAKLVDLSLLAMAQGTAVLDSGSHLIALRGYSLDQTTLQVRQGSVMRGMRTAELRGCTATVDGGELLYDNAAVYLDKTTAVELSADSKLCVSANTSEYVCYLGGSLVNRGQIEQWTVFRLVGSLTNYGEIRSGDTLLVSGILDNQGTILAEEGGSVRTSGSGTLTGAPPQAA